MTARRAPSRAPSAPGPAELPRLCAARVDSFRADGSLADLAAPMAEEIDFAAMAARLSRIARFNGVPSAGAFSIAQHCVMGTQAMLNEGEDELIAALFLLHDGHEALIGDKTRPVHELTRAVIRERAGPQAARAYDAAWSAIKAGWDEAIYTAARLPPPSAWTARMKARVHAMDERMLCAEGLALFGPQARVWADALQAGGLPKLTGAIRPWGPMKAEQAFVELFIRLRGQDLLTERTAIHAAHVATSGFSARS